MMTEVMIRNGEHVKQKAMQKTYSFFFLLNLALLLVSGSRIIHKIYFNRNMIDLYLK